MVEIITTVADMMERSDLWGRQGAGVALVPTMGYLHEGHAVLISEAARRRDTVVVSIFVNPTQFGPAEDFQRYPRDLARDEKIVDASGGEIIFAPSADDMYPKGYQTYIEVAELSRSLCGRHRPGHFRGVATVVLKLFNIIRPQVAVFGMKDYQQLKVIRRLAGDLNLPIEIVPMPIVREPDGLAMSSRNSYLSPRQRRQALCLSAALRRGEEAVRGGEKRAAAVVRLMRRTLIEAGVNDIDYASVVHPESLEEVTIIESSVLLAVAARVGRTRLIDNLLLID